MQVVCLSVGLVLVFPTVIVILFRCPRWVWGRTQRGGFETPLAHISRR